MLIVELLRWSGGFLGAFVAIVSCGLLWRWGGLWFRGWVSGANVRFLSLIGMSLRRVQPAAVVDARIMCRQAGLLLDADHGLSTEEMEAHLLAGGDIRGVVQALIAARSAGLQLSAGHAMLIDLAGRSVLAAVRTSITPQVIDCPDSIHLGSQLLMGMAKDGVLLGVRVRVTVRSNLTALVGGATEQTIIARVGHGIISAIGSVATYGELLTAPHLISKRVLDRGLDANTAFEIISLDVVNLEVLENVGARLLLAEAEAQTRMAQAAAEGRLAAARASLAEGYAAVAASRARLNLAHALLPVAVAFALRAGQLESLRPWQVLERCQAQAWESEGGALRYEKPLSVTALAVRMPEAWTAQPADEIAGIGLAPPH